ncbi:DUF418 domain-containing protein [Aurantiacibacter gilvus]|uniref:DUF418 domain-containing protein n=1 Tax=Aurantiacibacter gilvus TaxID=3139141 RepID=A0ABU9ICA2_9SPHN
MTASERIEALDFIRGFAILGILLANIVAFSNNGLAYFWPPALPGGASESDSWIWLAQLVLVDGKMRGLFALLFGAGLVLFTERKQGQTDGARLQARRLFWLAMFGMAHYALLFGGDILFMYAAAGFVALMGVHGTARGTLLAGIVWLVAAGALSASELANLALIEYNTVGEAAHPARAVIEEFWRGRIAENMIEAEVYADGSYAQVVGLRVSEGGDELLRQLTLIFYETIPQLLIGIGLFKAGLFTDADLRARWRPVAWLGIVIGLALLLAAGLFVSQRGFPPYQTQFVFFGVATLANLPILLGAVLLLTDFAAKANDSWLGERLRQAGRMAFSNYIGMSLVMMLIFQGWAGGMYGEYHRAYLLLFVLLGWALMLTFSRVWLAKFRYGPLEWLWRCLTYWRLFPLKR